MGNLPGWFSWQNIGVRVLLEWPMSGISSRIVNGFMQTYSSIKIDYLGGFFNDHEDIDLVFVGIVLSKFPNE